ncbi:MAG: hypothetical protein AB7N76_18840 [Planctomycetota bacterium]
MTLARALLALAPLVLTACLDREERIGVLFDGRVNITHRVQGDLGDFEDERPDLPGPPDFAVRITDRRQGERAVRALTATGSFASAADVPDRLGQGPGALRLSTELQREEAPGGGETFTFVRTYRARRWAAYTCPPDPGLVEQLRRVIQGSANADEQRRVIAALLRAERRRATQLALDALDDVAGPDPRLPLARLHTFLLVDERTREALPPEVVLELLRARPEATGPRVAELRRDLDARLVARAAATLDLSAAEREALGAALAGRRQALEVSEDLGDERFVVRLRLPGVLLAHNGDAVEDGEVVWRFEGQELWDRERVLIARSTTTPAR